MTDSNFQEGVGQKIVEALKQQDDSFVQQTEHNTFDFEQQADGVSLQNVENESNDYKVAFDTPQINAFNGNEVPFNEQTKMNFQNTTYSDATFQNLSSSQKNVANSTPQMHMPPNVAVLRRLIAQLPSGVTKQTGAQIIRQTMEALGISMNNVLHEAQQVQDGLNDSVKTCMYSIQEYKNNIKQLEKQALDYQKQIAYLNDLISLFVMTDKTR